MPSPRDTWGTGGRGNGGTMPWEEGGLALIDQREWNRGERIKRVRQAPGKDDAK